MKDNRKKSLRVVSFGTTVVTLEGSLSIVEQGENGKTLNSLQIERIMSYNPEKIRLIPFLFVCGEHARKDTGGEQAGSLLSLFNRKGHDACAVMKGLGEYPLVQDIFVEHAKSL